MTWGSNPTYQWLTCPHCGQKYQDDWNPPTHQMVCSKKPWFKKFKAWWNNHP